MKHVVLLRKGYCKVVKTTEADKMKAILTGIPLPIIGEPFPIGDDRSYGIIGWYGSGVGFETPPTVGKLPDVGTYKISYGLAMDILMQQEKES